MTAQNWLSSSIKFFVLLFIAAQLVSATEIQYLNFTSNYSSCLFGTGTWVDSENSFDANVTSYATYTVAGTHICNAYVVGNVTINENHPQNEQSVSIRRNWVWTGGTYAHLTTMSLYNWTSNEYKSVLQTATLGSGSTGTNPFNWSDDFLSAGKNISMKVEADVGDDVGHILRINENWLEWEPVANSCSSPAVGDWNIINGDNCNLSRNNIITGNLNISNGSLTIKNPATLTVGGEIWVYPKSNFTIWPGGSING